jgi:transcriptional regulator with XRE-family HTH domain
VPVYSPTFITVRVRWAPTDLKGLRGKRSLQEFGDVLGVTKNTVWRWEAGRVTPDVAQMKKLNELAAKQGYWDQWQLKGSATLVGNLEEASAKLKQEWKEADARSLAEFKR